MTFKDALFDKEYIMNIIEAWYNAWLVDYVEYLVEDTDNDDSCNYDSLFDVIVEKAKTYGVSPEELQKEETENGRHYLYNLPDIIHNNVIKYMYDKLFLDYRDKLFRMVRPIDTIKLYRSIILHRQINTNAQIYSILSKAGGGLYWSFDKSKALPYRGGRYSGKKVLFLLSTNLNIKSPVINIYDTIKKSVNFYFEYEIELFYTPSAIKIENYREVI